MSGRGSGSNVIPYQRWGPPVEDAQEAAQKPRTPFLPFTVSSLYGIEPKPVDWLVPGLLMRGEVTLLAGQTKLGKTFLCQQLMTAAAFGLPWLGREVSQFRSLGYFVEDKKDVLHWRQARINEHYGVEYLDFEQEAWLIGREVGERQLVTFPQRFGGPAKPTERWGDLARFCKAEGIRVVPIDTSACTFGGNENDRAQVTAYVDMLTQFAAEIDGAVMLNMHPSKGGSYYSGSTAWESSVRLTCSLERSRDYDHDTGQDEHVRVLHGMGSNYGAKAAPTRIVWKDGVFVEDAENAPAMKRPLTVPERADLDYRMLQGVRRACAMGARIPADEEATGSAPRRAARQRQDEILSRASWGELTASVQRLLQAERLAMVTIGRSVLVRPVDMRLPGEPSEA